jgi:hypothetical protein
MDLSNKKRKHGAETRDHVYYYYSAQHMQSQMYPPHTTIPSIDPPTYGHPPPEQQVFTPIQQQMYQPG